jgi:hypothetical protein
VNVFDLAFVAGYLCLPLHSAVSLQPLIHYFIKKPSPPLRTSQGTWARSNVKKAHTFTEHSAQGFLPHPKENEPEEEEALIQLRRPLTNSNRQSTVSKELKFKKSSTA